MNRAAFLIILLAILGGCRDDRPPVAVGTLERDRIELRAERQEPILLIDVREGNRVGAGDVMVTLDRRRLSADLDQATAGRDLSAARLAELMRGTRPEEIEQARAELAEVEAERLARRTDLGRVRNLVAEEVQPQSDLDLAEALHAAAVARVEGNRATLERLLNGATVEELDQARAELARGEAEIRRLEIDLERLIVTAPRDGVIDALPFEVGDEPPAGSVVAVILAGPAPFARVYVPAELRPSVTSGQKATVMVEGFPEPFEGRVRLISSEAGFTPYFALTERDRGHFMYLAEIDLVDDVASDLPTGLPVEVGF